MHGGSGLSPGLVTISLAALLAAAGCGGSEAVTGTSPPPSSPSVSSPSVSSASVSSPSVSSASASSASVSSASASSASASSVPTARCEVADLSVTLGAATAAAGGQQRRPVIVTNRSSRRCGVAGYPGVRFVARDGSAYDVVRSPLVRPGRIDLPPGADARATLTYLTTEAGDSGAFLPARVLVTPPDTSTAVPLAWDAGPVLDQSGATHPGTYIMAFTAG